MRAESHYDGLGYNHQNIETGSVKPLSESTTYTCYDANPTTDWKVCSITSDPTINYVRWYCERQYSTYSVWGTDGETVDVTSRIWDTTGYWDSVDDGPAPNLVDEVTGSYTTFGGWESSGEDGYGYYEFSTDKRTTKFTRDSLNSGESIRLWNNINDKTIVEVFPENGTVEFLAGNENGTIVWDV